MKQPDCPHFEELRKDWIEANSMAFNHGVAEQVASGCPSILYLRCESCGDLVYGRLLDEAA